MKNSKASQTRHGLGKETMNRLSHEVDKVMKRPRRGPRYRHTARFILFIVLMRLRSAIPLRMMSWLFRISLSTLWRWCERLTAIFASEPIWASSHVSALIVDSTSTRVFTTNRSYHSNYRKMRCAKVQVLCDEDGLIRHVSSAYRGAVHAKTIWDRESTNMPKIGTILADKAYAGGIGEGQILLRPIKRNDRSFRENPDRAKPFNRELSKRRISIEHVFAKLKTGRIIPHAFPNRPSRYETVFKAIVFIHNLEIQAKLKTKLM